MAETPVEVVIRARNESQAALNQAIGQLKQLEAQTKASGAAGLQLANLRNALGALSPQAAAAANQMETLAKAFGPLGGAGLAAAGVAAAVGLIGAAGVAAAKGLADTVEQLDNLAATTGANIDDLQVLQELFKRAGIGADTARTALHNLNRAIGEQDPLLKKLGVTSRDPIQALMQLADAFQTSHDAGLRAKVAQDLLGRGGKDLLAVLEQLRTAFPALSREMDITGQKLSPGLVKAGRDLDIQFEQLSGRWEGHMNRMKEAAGGFFLAVVHGGPMMLAYARAQEKAREEAERSTESWERYRKSFVPVVDLLAAGTKKQTELTAAQKAHATAVKELVDLFGMEQKAAERAIDGQERLAKARRKAALEKELFTHQVSGIEVKGTPEARMGVTPGFQFPLEGQGLGETALDPTAREKMLADWRAFIDEITSGTQVINDSLSALAGGLAGGLTTVFQNLLAEGQTFGSAMASIFRNMVNAMLAELARLLAFKFLRLLLGDVTALLPGSTMGSPGFVYPKAGLERAPAGTAAAAGGMVPGGNTYVIQTLNAHDLVAEMVLPGGSLRRAQDRVRVAGAY